MTVHHESRGARWCNDARQGSDFRGVSVLERDPGTPEGIESVEVDHLSDAVARSMQAV